MSPGRLTKEELVRDAEFSKAMHGKSAEQRNAFMSMLTKDHEAHRIITNDYINHWDNQGKAIEDTAEAREKRKENYMSVVNK